MPEGLEIEYYRRTAERALDRTIAEVRAPDAWYLKRGLTAAPLQQGLVGASFTAARRIGKVLLLDIVGVRAASPAVLALRFGMTGVLEVDGGRGVEQLQYSPAGRDDAWIRFGVTFTDGGSMAVRDPRRLGGVEADPDLARLGPDALTITPTQLNRALAGSDAPLKARLLDQQRVAGLGNLLVDEILWRAGLDPARAAGSLGPAERRRLHRHLRFTLADLLERGGSHTGDLMVARTRGASCPRCGAPLARRTIGGRTTYSCPAHQL